MLNKYQKSILTALANGAVLKSHRDVDGGKIFLLHYDDGRSEQVRRRAVLRLVRGGYLQSNQKFPAATFYLIEKGREAIR